MSMNSKHDEDHANIEPVATVPAPRRATPGTLWWPGVMLALLTLVVTLPALNEDRELLAVASTAAVGFVLAGVPRIGALLPLATGIVVIGELIWFERFGSAPGAAVATAIAAGAACFASLLLAERARAAVRDTAEIAAALEATRRRDAVQNELLDSNELSQIDVDISRSRRYRRPLSVLLIQIDNVELLERRLGADAVQAAHIELARVVTRHARIADSRVAHGSSVMLGLPETEHDGARILAERIRLSFGALKLVGIDDIPLTVSIGIASYPIDGEHGEEVLRHARSALLDAIAEGGNRSRIAAPPAA